MTPQTTRNLLRLLAGVLAAALAAIFTLTWVHGRRAERAVQARGFAQCAQAAAAIHGQMAAMEGVARDLAAKLGSGQIRPGQIQAEVARTLLAAPPGITRMGVLFRPGVAAPGGQPFGPYAERIGQRVHAYRYESIADYRVKEWFVREPWRAGWEEPHLSHRGGLAVDFTQPFHLPGAGADSGLVRLNVDLQGIQDRVDQLDLGNLGFAYLLSAKGVYLAHPVDDLVRSQKTMMDRADNAGRRRLADLVARGEGGFTESTSRSTGLETWVFLQHIPDLDWSIALVYSKQDLHLKGACDRELVALDITLGLALALVLIFLGFRGHELGRDNLWKAVIAGSAAMVAANVILFYFVNTLPPAESGAEFQMMDPTGLEKFKLNHEFRYIAKERVRTTFIPTGVFLQAMEAAGPGLTRMTGMIWQRLPKATPRDQRGISFPEAVSAEAQPGIEQEEGDSIIQFYPFKAVVREEAGSESAYPFDRARIRLRLLPRPFLKPVILVPDLDSYLVPAPKALPGVDRDLQLPGWRVEAAEFAYALENYNVTFGTQAYHGETSGPELLFRVTLKRNFGTPSIAAFLPLLAVAGLLFTLVLTVSQTSDKVKATGYGYLNFLRTTIALFFSLMVAQFNIRGRIVADGVISLEWYFFIMYAAILGVSINALVFAISDNPVLRYDDNAVAKLAFWPVLLGCFYLNSLTFLW